MFGRWLGGLRHPSAALRAGFDAMPFQSSFKLTHCLTFNKRSDAEKKAYWDWRHSQH
jgi:hypothetical protein